MHVLVLEILSGGEETEEHDIGLFLYEIKHIKKMT